MVGRQCKPIQYIGEPVHRWIRLSSSADGIGRLPTFLGTISNPLEGEFDSARSSVRNSSHSPQDVGLANNPADSWRICWLDVLQSTYTTSYANKELIFDV